MQVFSLQLPLFPLFLAPSSDQGDPCLGIACGCFHPPVPRGTGAVRPSPSLFPTGDLVLRNGWGASSGYSVFLAPRTKQYSQAPSCSSHWEAMGTAGSRMEGEFPCHLTPPGP